MNHYIPTITLEEQSISVHATYHPVFKREAHRLGGVYRANAWCFSVKDEIAVRNLCVECYGYDGINPAVTVDVRLIANAEITSDPLRPINIFSRPLAWISRSGQIPKTALGTIFEAGNITGSGGCSIIATGTTIVLRDVPVNIYRRDIESIPGLVCEEIQPDFFALEYLQFESQRYHALLLEIQDILSQQEDTEAFCSVLEKRAVDRLMSHVDHAS